MFHFFMGMAVFLCGMCLMRIAELEHPAGRYVFYGLLGTVCIIVGGVRMIIYIMSMQ